VFEAPLVDVERRRVVARRVIRADYHVPGESAVLLDALHEEGRVLARAEIGRGDDAFDAGNAIGDGCDDVHEFRVAVGPWALADNLELRLAAVHPCGAPAHPFEFRLHVLH